MSTADSSGPVAEFEAPPAVLRADALPAYLPPTDAVPADLPPAGAVPAELPPADALPSRRELRRQARAGRDPLLPPWAPAAVALVLAAVVVILNPIGVALAGRGDFVAATVIAAIGIGLSAVAVLGGIACVVLRRGRALAVAAIVLGLLANPFLLTRLLELFRP